MGEQPTIFYPNYFTLEPYNSNQNAILIAENTQLRVVGETVSVDDKYINLVWNTTDIINHGYLKYRTQNGLSGVVTQFDFVGGDYIIPYSDINTLQFMEIHDLNGSVYQVALGFLGEVLNFTKTDTKRVLNSMMITGQRWLKWNSIELKYNGLVATLGTDYTIDYVQGIIGFPQGTRIQDGDSLTVTGQYHSSTKYIIDFNSLYQGLHTDSLAKIPIATVDKINLPISFKKGIAKGTLVDFQLSNMTTINGDLTMVSNSLKQNSLNLIEDYKYTKGIDPIQLVRNQTLLGYKNKLVLNLGDGDYAKIKSDGFANEVTVLDEGFKLWYSRMVQNAKSLGYSEALVIIPFEHRYLPTTYYQKSVDGFNTNRLTPINPSVVLYIQKIVSEIRLLSEGHLNVQFGVEKLGWGVDSRGYFTIHDDYTKSLYASEVGGTIYGTIDTVANLEVPVSQELDIATWLSSKLVSTLATLGGSMYLRVLVDVDLITQDNFTKKINNSFIQWKNYIGKFILVNYDWNGEVVKKHINLLNQIYSEIGLTPAEIGYIASGINEMNNTSPNTTVWTRIGQVISDVMQESEMTEIMIPSHAVRRDSYFVYKPMTFFEISSIGNQDLKFDLALCKANKQIVGYLPMVRITNIQRAVDDIDTIDIEVPYLIPDRLTHNMRENPYYYGIADEKLLLLNDKEYYIIKEVNESKGEKTIKKAKAYSLEWKLTKRSVFIQEKLFQLYSTDVTNADGVLNQLEKETGWKVQYVDENAKFEVIDGVTTKKYRWFDGVNKDWHTFLMEDVAKSFNVLFQFNTLDKTINVFDNESIGRNQGLYLSEDNYIKNVESTATSMDIITRLYPTGKEELGITNVNPFGVPYVEDFSYFVEQGDMSEGLAEALIQHEIIAEGLYPQWKELNLNKIDKQRQLLIYQQEMIVLDSEITGLNALRTAYINSGDTTHLAEIESQLQAKTTEKNDKQSQITITQNQLTTIDGQIASISMQLDRATVVDGSDNNLFTPSMLDELDEFIYSDTWVDDTHIKEETLLEGSKIEIGNRCRPTVVYNLDVVNFLERMYTRRKGWRGELFLRDIILLKTQNTQEVELYLVGFSYSPQDKKLTIELSTKESKRNNAKTIGSVLSKANETRKLVEMNKYLWNKSRSE